MRKSPVQCRGTAIVHPANAASSFGEAAVSKERNGGARDPVMIWGLVCLLAISAGLLLWHHYGMNRTLRVTAADHYTIWPYDDRDLGGKSVGNVETTPSAIVLRCALKKSYASPYCGFSVALAADAHSVDLARFDTIALDIDADGMRKLPVRIYLRNFDPKYARKGDPASLKVNQMDYIPQRESHPLVLPLTVFQVAPWWISSHDIPPSESMPDLRNVTVLEVATGDFAKPGNYTVHVRSITFHGKWVTGLQLLSVVLVAWIIAAVLFVASSVLRSLRAVRVVQLQNRELEDVNAALELQRQELEAVATHDDLTGLYNRVGLRSCLYKLVLRAREHQGALSVIFVDVDHFKDVNDRHGHLAGDRLLVQLAALLQNHTRGSDCLCRWGGEEFVLLCGDTPLRSACRIAEKLRALISSHAWTHKIELRCSFGVAQMGPEEDVGSLFKRADTALYHAKQNGRDRVECSPAAVVGTLDPVV